MIKLKTHKTFSTDSARNGFYIFFLEGKVVSYEHRIFETTVIAQMNDNMQSVRKRFKTHFNFYCLRYVRQCKFQKCLKHGRNLNYGDEIVLLLFFKKSQF